jgi:hypothetical protein
MADSPSFAKLVPGFEFLQGLVRNAGAALPNMGQWIAPTLNPEELDKRIDELRTVQFWLEQNARMLATTIQALEVQRMTLSTLQTMNVQMTDLRDAMKLAPVASVTSAAGAAASSFAQSMGAEALLNAAKGAMVGGPKAPADDAVGAAATAPAPEASPAPAPAARAARTSKAAAAKVAETAAPMGVVDPMQWWGALTKQFTQIAANAMKDTAADAAKNLAGAMMKQGVDAAGEALRKAVTVPAGVAQKAMSAASQAASATGAAAAAKKGAAKTAANPAPAGAAKPAARKRAPAKTATRGTKAGAH